MHRDDGFRDRTPNASNDRDHAGLRGVLIGFGEGAALRLQPDQPMPTDWPTCPLCDGDGCGDCDGRGVVHPRRWPDLEAMLARVFEPLHRIEERLFDERLPRRAAREDEWWIAQGLAARRLLRRWAEEDGLPSDAYERADYVPDPRQAYE